MSTHCKTRSNALASASRAVQHLDPGDPVELTLPSPSPPPPPARHWEGAARGRQRPSPACGGRARPGRAQPRAWSWSARVAPPPLRLQGERPGRGEPHHRPPENEAHKLEARAKTPGDGEGRGSRIFSFLPWEWSLPQAQENWGQAWRPAPRIPNRFRWPGSVRNFPKGRTRIRKGNLVPATSELSHFLGLSRHPLKKTEDAVARV